MATSHSIPPTPRLSLDAVSGPPLPPITPTPDKPTVLGRSGQSDAILGDEAVSRRHCSISARNGEWFIEDLGSRHGTFVQAAKLASGQSTPLKNGDMVGIGPWLLRARIGQGGGELSNAGQRVVTLMDPASTVGPNRAGSSGPGASSILRERVERVQERELAAMNQNRLKLLIDVAAAVAGTSDEESLARMITSAAVQGTGFPRGFLLRDETIGPAAPAEGAPPAEGTSDTLRVVFEIDPDAVPGPDGQHPPPTFSRSLIAAARKSGGGEVVRLTNDSPMQGQSIMSLGIQTALCAPIVIGAGVAGFLYLDSRIGERNGSGGSGSKPGGPASGLGSGVQHDAAAFCSALAKMYSLALSNISRHELESRQRELERDMEAASEVQKRIMPPPTGTLGRIRYAMRSKSGRYVAGDLFDVVDFGEDAVGNEGKNDGRVGVLLGDVSGKGVPAAILMATAQTHLHAALREGHDPARAVRAVNRHICRHMASNKFISLWIGVFEPAPDGRGGGTLRYVDAGHGYWLLTRPGQAPFRAETATGIPLGIEETFEFEAATITIEPGQRLIVFSDGVVEQPEGGNAGTAQFGVEGAIAAISGSNSEQEDVDRIFEAVLAHAKGPNLADDTTVASVTLA